MTDEIISSDEVDDAPEHGGFVQEIADDDALHFYIELDDGLKLEVYTREGARTVLTLVIAAGLLSIDKVTMLTAIHRAALLTDEMLLDEVATLSELFRLRPNIVGMIEESVPAKPDLHHDHIPPKGVDAE